MIQYSNFMTKCKQFILILSLLTLSIACGDNKNKEVLRQAFDIHEEAVKVRGRVSDKMTRLSSIQDTTFLMTFKADLDSIAVALEEWDEQLVEVPGFDEEHDHSGHDHSGHEHDHDNEPQLTPAQHVELQQFLLQEIKSLEEKINLIQEPS